MSATSGITPPPRRVLIVGLDGATWTCLAPRIASGQMPTLHKLQNQGAWGVLTSTIPALTPPAWTSLVTGTNPGKHGIYHFRHTPEGDYYQRRLNTSRDVQAPTLWQRAGQAGQRVGIINVPLSHPVYTVNGFITSDAFAPDLKGLTAYPPELTPTFQRVTPDVSNYPTARPGTRRYVEQMLAFVAENERVIAEHADVAVQLMRTQPWQLFMVVWLILDRLQHFGWRFCDPALASALRSTDEQRVAARFTETFQKLDRQLARLIEAAGEQCTVIVASDHGFGPIPGAFFHTNRWLVQKNYLKLLPAWHWRRWVVGNFPRAWRGRWHLPLDSKFGVVNWRATRVWADCLEARAVGLRINRVDRYPHGIVAEAEYTALRQRLASELHQVEADGGQKVFTKIHPREELYHGPHAEAAPDLVAILAKPFDGPPSFRRDLASKQLLTANRHVLRDGGHEPEGIFALWGKPIRPVNQLSPQQIEAIAPTALSLLGVPLDDDLDGRPIASALSEELLTASVSHEQKPVVAPSLASPAQPEYSGEDSALVEERLSKLGYLD